ncbi:MAG: hypothetical protein ABEH38_01505 [Flavobacteriales bacterium]
MSSFENTTDALRFFGLSGSPTREAIDDAYEKTCFEVRQKALMNIGVPRTMKKRFEVLERAAEAYGILSGTEISSISAPSFETTLSFEDACELLGSPPPWTSCLRTYEEGIGEAQLRAANSFSAIPLAGSLRDLIRYQQAYHAVLYEGFAAIFMDPEHYPKAIARTDRQIKASQKAYSGMLIQDLAALEKAGVGNKGLIGVPEDLERILEQDPCKGTDGIERILTEGYRIHNLLLLDKKRREQKPKGG